MAQREDIILKRLQTNIAEHEGRKEEAEAEGGAMSRIAQNVLLESELAGKFTEKIMNPIEQFMDEKAERAEIARTEDVTKFYDTQSHERLFGRTEYNLETGERTHIKPAQNILEQQRGRFTGIGPDGKPLYTATPGSRTGYMPGWETLSDMDTQVLLRASTKGVWINADGTYKTINLGNLNNLSDDGVSFMANNKDIATESKNQDSESFVEEKPIPDKDFTEEEVPLEGTVNPWESQEFKTAMSSYEKVYKDTGNPATDRLYYKNWFKRGTLKNINKHVETLKEDPTNSYARNYLRKNAPDVYKALKLSEGEEK